MFGSIAGDIIGSAYENKPINDGEFPLITENTCFTDSSVLSIAVSEAFRGFKYNDFETVEVLYLKIAYYLSAYCRAYPDVRFGTYFKAWAQNYPCGAYFSMGTGSAMRVSSIPYYFSEDFEIMRKAARLSARVTHNTDEAIEGADSIACAIWLAMHDHSKESIKEFIEREFEYDLSKSLNDIRKEYSCSYMCQFDIPAVFIALFDSNSYEEAIRNVISLGGDTSTMACMVGGIAEPLFGMPEDLEYKCLEVLESHLSTSMIMFEYNCKWERYANPYRRKIICQQV